jgi:hypothetical protein
MAVFSYVAFGGVQFYVSRLRNQHYRALNSFEEIDGGRRWMRKN